MSVLLTERMASRSLISSRPMISALAVYSSSAMGTPYVGRPLITTIIGHFGDPGEALPLVTLVTGVVGLGPGVTRPCSPFWHSGPGRAAGACVDCGAVGRFGCAGVKGSLRRPAAALDPGSAVAG